VPFDRRNGAAETRGIREGLNRGAVNNMALYNFYLSPDISRNEDGRNIDDQEISKPGRYEER
jgi:hypothetical protein